MKKKVHHGLTLEPWQVVKRHCRGKKRRRLVWVRGMGERKDLNSSGEEKTHKTNFEFKNLRKE